MKKMAAGLIISSLLLTGCFNGNDEEKKSTPEDLRTKTYETAEFSVKLPEPWEVIEPNHFTAEIPSETLVIFRNNVKNPEFTANVNITRNLLTSQKSSLDYAKDLAASHQNTLINFIDLGKNDIEVETAGQKVPTLLLNFEGKKRPEDAAVRFSQLAVTKGSNAYVMTSARLPSEDPVVEKMLDGILRSFTVK